MMTCGEQIALRLDMGVREMIHAWLTVRNPAASHFCVTQIVSPAVALALPSPEMVAWRDGLEAQGRRMYAQGYPCPKGDVAAAAWRREQRYAASAWDEATLRRYGVIFS